MSEKQIEFAAIQTKPTCVGSPRSQAPPPVLIPNPFLYPLLALAIGNRGYTNEVRLRGLNYKGDLNRKYQKPYLP